MKYAPVFIRIGNQILYLQIGSHSLSSIYGLTTTLYKLIFHRKYNSAF